MKSTSGRKTPIEFVFTTTFFIIAALMSIMFLIERPDPLYAIPLLLSVLGITNNRGFVHLIGEIQRRREN